MFSFHCSSKTPQASSQSSNNLNLYINGLVFVLFFLFFLLGKGILFICSSWFRQPPCYLWMDRYKSQKPSCTLLFSTIYTVVCIAFSCLPFTNHCHCVCASRCWVGKLNVCLILNRWLINGYTLKWIFLAKLSNYCKERHFNFGNYVEDGARISIVSQHCNEN